MVCLVFSCAQSCLSYVVYVKTYKDTNKESEKDSLDNRFTKSSREKAWSLDMRFSTAALELQKAFSHW